MRNSSPVAAFLVLLTLLWMPGCSDSNPCPRGLVCDGDVCVQDFTCSPSRFISIVSPLLMLPITSASKL